MTNEKGFTAYALLGQVADDMVVDTLLPEDRGAGVAPVKKERPRRFMSFLESGWGVAIICALVAVSVMGGIIWAGNQTGTGVPPGGTVEPESEGNTIETNTPLLEQNNVVVYGADGACYPKRILCNSTDLTQGEDGLEHGVTADGLGFVGHMKQYGGADLPTVVWAKDVETTDYVDVAPNYTITQISMYDMNMVEQMTKTAMTLDDEMFAARFIERWLSVGKWYVSFRVTHREGNSHHCECDYAFIADVRQTLDTIVTRNCTVKTDKDRYEWGNPYYFTATLTSTVEGAYLQVDDPDAWLLVNLDTGEKGSVGVIDTPYDTLIAPASPASYARSSYPLFFDWKTTPPGRYRLTYTGTEPAEGEEYPYYDFEIYEHDVYVLEAYGDNPGNITALEEQIAWGEGDPVIDVVFSIQDSASNLPIVSVKESAGCQIVGTEIRSWILYDENFNILYQGREWSNPVEAGIGTFYVEILGYKQGDYIPEADEYEGGLYTYAFCLEVRPYCDGSCAETELPYDVETTPVE